MTARTPEERERAVAAVEEARTKGYGPQTPRTSARKAMRWLYSRGATYSEIAELFDLSSEAVRIAVLGKSTRLLTDPEWQLVLWLRSAKLSPASVQAALERSGQGRRSDDKQEPELQPQAPA